MKKKCFLLVVMLFCFLPSPLWAAPSSNDLHGIWGFSFFTRDSDGKWAAEGGKGVFNSNGTGSMEIYRGDSNGLTSVPPPGGLAFTYSASPTTNGTLNLQVTIGSAIENYLLVFSDTKDMILMDGTRNPALQRIGIFCRINEANDYSSEDISGNAYYGIGYELGLLTNPRDYSSFSFDVGSATPMAIDGAARKNKNGTPGPPYTFNSNYTVGPNGNILMLSPDLPEGGYISQNRNAVVYYQVKSSAVGTYLFLKKGDKVYSTLDLAGKFILAGIGGLLNGGNEKAAASIASLTCDGTGHCVMALRSQSNGMVEFETSVNDFSVAADGSFGASLGPGFPTYGAALGNGGNTLIFNPSFLGDPTVPEIFIGVRCSDCIYPFSGHLPLILRD